MYGRKIKENDEETWEESMCQRQKNMVSGIATQYLALPRTLASTRHIL